VVVDDRECASLEFAHVPGAVLAIHCHDQTASGKLADVFERYFEQFEHPYEVRFRHDAPPAVDEPRRNTQRLQIAQERETAGYRVGVWNVVALYRYVAEIHEVAKLHPDFAVR
jgi:hypothetical protein